MSNDPFVRRLRQSLRAATDQLPLRVTGADVERRRVIDDGRIRQRRMVSWLGAVCVAAVVVTGAMLLPPNGQDRDGNARASQVPGWDGSFSPVPAGPCAASAPVTRDWYSEVGGPQAWFEAYPTLYAPATWPLFVRFTDEIDLADALAVWAVRDADATDRVDADLTWMIGGPHAHWLGDQGRVELAGTYLMAQIGFDRPGCWTLHASVNGVEVGSATVKLTSAWLDACHADLPDAGEVGGPHAFFGGSTFDTRTAYKFPVRVTAESAPHVVAMRFTALFSPDSSVVPGATEIKRGWVPTTIAGAKPGDWYFGILEAPRAGCWRLEALGAGDGVLGSATVRIVDPLAHGESWQPPTPWAGGEASTDTAACRWERQIGGYQETGDDAPGDGQLVLPEFMLTPTDPGETWRLWWRMRRSALPDWSLTTWATPTSGGPRVPGLIDRTPGEGPPDAPAEMQGTYHLAQQPLPYTGCWTMSVAINGVTYARATLPVIDR